MTTRQPVTKRFGHRERERLVKLCRQLGTDNAHEAEAVRSRIDSLLRSFGKTWADLADLLGGGTAVALDAAVAADIILLGDHDFDRRTAARIRIVEFLDHHRKTWNDLIDGLMGIDPAWLAPAAPEAPERVNPLTLTCHLLEEYIDLRPHEYVMVALWTLHTHVFRQFLVTPRLLLRSPVAGCGKTQLIDVLAKLTARPKKFDSITTAAIVRAIDENHPTLLIDEADNLGMVLQPNGKLRAVFNSGHRNGGTVAQMERGELRTFSTFAPLLLALPETVQGLPRTLNSRCITLQMRRTDGQRELKRILPYRPDAALDAAHDQILMWRKDAVLDSNPEMPEGIRNRLADNWRPLLSIADSLGWGEQARKALAEFAREYQDADVGILLLSDTQKVFGSADRMPGKLLLDRLHGLDEADWGEFRGIRGDQMPHKLTAGELASIVRAFGIRSRSIWPLKRTTASKSQKGFYRHQFESAWRMYCDTDGTSAQSRHANGLHVVKTGSP